jgi:hypothetical protein
MDNNLQLTALLPDQMMEAQSNLISWCDRKISSVEAEVTELAASIEHARKSKWSLKTLKSQHSKAVKRVTFFVKMREALKAGYYIVPNFPVQIFAIRTKLSAPHPMHSNDHWGDKRQSAQELPIGKGYYKDPLPFVALESDTDANGKVTKYSYAENWDEEMEFPVTMLKPEIIEATNRAMAIKLFDQFGILPATKKEDPIIVGQILNGKKLLSFMIAWHFNTNIL